MALSDIPTENKLVVAITGAVGIVWAVDWLQEVGQMEYKLLLILTIVLLIFMEIKNE